MTWWSRLVEFGSRKALQPGSGLPYYTELERNRLGKIRRDFSDLENSPEINRLGTEYESELLSLPRRPAEDEPLLASLIVPPSGFFTVTLPDSTPCLLTFSTPLRAGEIRAHPCGVGAVTVSALESKEICAAAGQPEELWEHSEFCARCVPPLHDFPQTQYKFHVGPCGCLANLGHP